jgi:hypothetical protein
VLKDFKQLYLVVENLTVDSHVLNSVYMYFVFAVLLVHFEAKKNPAMPTGCEKGDSPNEWITYCQDLYFPTLMLLLSSTTKVKDWEYCRHTAYNVGSACT